MQHDQKGQAYYLAIPIHIWEIPDQQWDHSGSHGTAGIQAGILWDLWLESLMQWKGGGY